jgi:transcriptional regulator with XRE-family HTH domain
MAELSPERRARIEAETERLHQEYLTLQQLRKARQMTQVELAEKLNIRQETVAQMEKRSDLMLSTLRSSVEALGGRLKLVVEFPNHAPVALVGLGEQAEDPENQARTDSLS